MSFSVVIFPTSLGICPVKLFHMKSLEKEHSIQVSKHMLGNLMERLQEHHGEKKKSSNYENKQLK
jgi:hypothetical protein